MNPLSLGRMYRSACCARRTEVAVACLRCRADRVPSTVQQELLPRRTASSVIRHVTVQCEPTPAPLTAPFLYLPAVLSRTDLT